MRVGLHGMVRRVWGRRGAKVRQRRQIVYEWRYLFLVVDGQQGRLFWCWMPALNALETRGVIRGLQKASDLAGVVWDRAPAHTDQSVRKLGMPLVSLPPYSPELNPAERIFEELRRAVEGVVYASLDANPDLIRSLAGWNWINEALEQPSLAYAA